MYKFNTTSVEVRLIKNILRNAYLPIIPTISNGDYAIKGMDYIYKNKIIHITKQGTFIDDEYTFDGINYINGEPTIGESTICDNALICGLGYTKALYDITKTFSYNEWHPGITTLYDSVSDMYDKETHAQLGKYLRWYRDFTGIDLMPLYNCFAGEDTHYIGIKGNKLTSVKEPNKTVWIIPAHLNKKYKIYVNTPYACSIGSSFLNNLGRIRYTNLEKNTKFVDDLLNNESITHYSSLNYNQPITYFQSTLDQTLMGYDNNFYIIIQTENNHTPSIAVFEGDVLRDPIKFITSRETPKSEYNIYINYKTFNLPVISSILRVPTQKIIPYSPKLIEFLTENAITPLEDIPNNILRVQNKLNYHAPSKDIWGDKLKFIIYNKYFNPKLKYHITENSDITNNDIPKIVYEVNEDNTTTSTKIVGTKNCKSKIPDYNGMFDITGYIDTNIEKYLGV